MSPMSLLVNRRAILLDRIGIGARRKRERHPRRRLHAADPATRRVGGGRKRHPLRHPRLGLGAPVGPRKAIGDDRLQGLRLLTGVRRRYLGACDLAGDGEQHFAVAQLVEERRVGLPMLAHIGAEMKTDHLDRLAARRQGLAHDDRHDLHNHRIGEFEQPREQRRERGPVETLAGFGVREVVPDLDPCDRPLPRPISDGKGIGFTRIL
jgi:hypothetical protein